MKGYYDDEYYHGYLPSIGRYQSFSTEAEYRLYFKEFEN